MNQRTYQRNRNLKNKRIVFEQISHNDPPFCLICDEEDFDVLTLDHVNNDGKAWRKIHGMGSAMHEWLIRNKFPEEPQLEVLCANCNLRKETYRRREKK